MSYWGAAWSVFLVLAAEFIFVCIWFGLRDVRDEARSPTRGGAPVRDPSSAPRDSGRSASAAPPLLSSAMLSGALGAELHVRDPWLRLIQGGRKTVEGRKGPQSKFAPLVGRRVALFNEDCRVEALVTGVRHYSTLYEYLDAEGLERVAPHLRSRQAVVNAYHEFPGNSDEGIRAAGGMNAIELALPARDGRRRAGRPALASH
jgi:ASC-1-like (ASCH) protein